MGIPLKMAKFRWLELVVVLVISRWVDGLESSGKNVGNGNGVLMVDLTLVQGAASKGAVCLDGTLPGYHLHNGFGSGVNSWLIELEGGGWCTDIQSCVSRKNSALGSSNNMTSNAFTGLLSNKPEENPDFYNWNRVRVRYCDGASFAGEGYDEANKLYFRGQRIWSAVMEELLSKGLRNADQALLSGCSAGGLASILHCDQFKALFPNNNNSSSSSSKIIKCLSDAGFFLDATDISGGHFIRDYYHGVVTLQEVAKNLPSSCTDHLDPTSCFFPQNVIAHVKTPLFILNAAYDSWQVKEILVPPKTDPHGLWHDCKQNISKCSPSQLHLLQGLRTLMISVVNTTSFAGSSQNGLFINSCYTHCQSEMQQTWFANNSPILEHKKVATAIGDWFFDRAPVKLLDCPYPCDNSCLNEVSI